LVGCVATNPRRHNHAYAVDGAVLVTGVVLAVVGALQLSACHRSNDAGCATTPTITTSLGSSLTLLGATGAIANAAWTEWWPFNWNAPPPPQGWQRPSKANPPVVTSGNQD
jgi:hypothetical protein